MRALTSYRVQRLEAGGINYEQPERQIVVWGFHADDTDRLITGIKFGDTLLERLPGEEVEILRIRAMREVVPLLPPDALRDSKGKPVGYFTYSGLPPDHCEVTPERLAGR
jgi:hypothetical protein